MRLAGALQKAISIRIAALVKQVPTLDDLDLGPGGRLRRDVGQLEMSAYCRRAVAKGVELAKLTSGTCTVLSLGPVAAEDVLREAVAWGADDGVLLCDPELAGSDTLATARALVAAIARLGPFELVLVGRNSLDADTGQVGPSIAELLGWPFLAAIRRLSLQPNASSLSVRCERDDGWAEAIVKLPAVLSCAERLCDPAKQPPDARASVAASRLRVLRAADLGLGPWGVEASRTDVGEVRVTESVRAARRLSGSLESQVAEAVEVLRASMQRSDDAGTPTQTPDGDLPHGPNSVAVIIEPRRDRTARELLGTARAMVAKQGGAVIASTSGDWLDAPTAASWGAHRLVLLNGSPLPHDLAVAYANWLEVEHPWGLLGPASLWGREILARVAARLDIGLTGDAVGLEMTNDRLVAWKPAFGGRMLAAIRSRSDIQAATVRPGVLPLPSLWTVRPIPEDTISVAASGSIQVVAEERDDDPDRMAIAPIVVGVGSGVHPDDYGALASLANALSAEIAATRRVTDAGWMPHSRQVGITGRSISPLVYIAIGLSGKPNHMLGVRGAGTILAINEDPAAAVFDRADIGIVADWRHVVPMLALRCERELCDLANRDIARAASDPNHTHQPAPG